MCRAPFLPPGRSFRRHAPFFLTLLLFTLTPLRGAPAPGTADPSALRETLARAWKALETDTTWQRRLVVIEMLSRLLETGPPDADALRRQLAEQQIEMLDIERAERTVETIERACAQARVAAATDGLRGRIAERRDRQDEALAFYRRHLDARPDDVRTWERVARLERLRGDPAAAIVAHTRLIELGDTAARRIARAEILVAARRWDDALADADAANRLAPTDALVKRHYPSYERLRGALGDIKRLEEEIARPGGNDVTALLRQAALLLALEQPALAAENCRRVRALEPDRVLPTVLLARALIAAGHARQAAELRYMVLSGAAKSATANLDRLHALDERRRAVPADADALYEQAWILNEEKQYLLAHDVATRLHSAPVQDPRGLVEAAFALGRLGDTRQGIELARRATDANPKSANAWRVRGELEMARADFVAAIDSLSRSLECERSADVLRMRERCYRVTGQRDKAEADLTAAGAAR